MNAERLHAISIALRDDLAATKTVGLLANLVQALQGQVSSPQESSHQQTVASTIQQLTEALNNSVTNKFSPVWREDLNELGGEGLFGESLLRRIRSIFARNQITPAIALEEITSINAEIGQMDKAIQGLTASLGLLKVGTESLEAGECEIGILVPRAAVHNSLDGFARELGVLHRMLSVFSEMITGTRPGFSIRSISSSELSVFLDSIPGVAAVVSVAIERVISGYKRILEIRVLRQQLANNDVPDDRLGGLDEHINEVMEQRIQRIVRDFEEQYGGRIERTRWNELRTELEGSLTQIANRIDRGYNFDVRVEPTDEEGDDNVDEETRQAIETILESAQGLEFLRLEGDPVLSLPEPERDNSQLNGEPGEPAVGTS